MALTGCEREASAPDKFSLVIGSKGHSSGKFNRPRGICWHRAMESIYVLDWDGTVQRFTLDGRWKASWLMPEVEKGKPEDICVAPNGNLLIADTHYSRIVEFDPVGNLIGTFGSYGKGPGQFIYPVGIISDPNGNIYVSEYGENDRIQKFDRQGNFITEFGSFGDAPGQFQRPSGIDLSPSGHLYVADACNHRIQVFDSDGNLIRILGALGDGPGAFRYPYDVAVRENFVYVLEYGGQRVQKLDMEGHMVASYGQPGRDEGCFYSPWRFTVCEDYLFVSDTQNNRVVKVENL